MTFNWEIDFGFLLALIGVGLSVWSLIRTRKLEKQQLIINQYKIEEKEREREEKKHAHLKLKGFSENLHCYMLLTITNHGECEANKIKVDILNESLNKFPEGLSIKGSIPEIIEPGERCVLTLLCYTRDEILKAKLSWEDKAGYQESIQSIQINCDRD